MEKSARIEAFYSEVVAAFVKDVSADNKETFGEAYRRYLHRRYDEYFDAAEDSAFDRIATMCVLREKATSLAKREADKQAMLFPDEEYIKLEELSLEVGRMARVKKNGGQAEPSKSREEYETELNRQFEKVSELFKYTAQTMLSEALLDLRYIFEGGEAFSFRLGNLTEKAAEE